MENWTWGLSLIALTIATHVAGLISMALAGVRLMTCRHASLS